MIVSAATVAVGAAIAVWALFAVSTGIGQFRRSHRAVDAAAGAFFPVTWIVWYLRDGDASRRVRARRDQQVVR